MLKLVSDNICFGDFLNSGCAPLNFRSWVSITMRHIPTGRIYHQMVLANTLFEDLDIDRKKLVLALAKTYLEVAQLEFLDYTRIETVHTNLDLKESLKEK